ncbi:U3 small nucleolar RNA-associated protein 25 homolog [Plodia interpunctella]|uniref:U3 small nucleolar RNA-associated protein 25 homolog n=1 Tax=Plodia interpunctella TaxID=58824 RepID=UPI002368D268|nr:U3 small nucleolar RNA-associated protein 25 homolog [Plodia interpunctella]XP_053614064.1 U3 small nucleolar RNA-associated protein 25 homolog [Plodia interpunctella]
MSKGKKILGKKRKGVYKKETKRKKGSGEKNSVNKKAIFNRYKNKQKVEEELAKKKQLEKKFQLEQVTFSESEEEEDVYEQLVACFGKGKVKKVVDSDESEEESGSVVDDVEMSAEVGKGNSQLGRDYDNNDASSVQDSDEEIVQLNDVEDNNDSEEDPFTKHLEYELSDEMLIALTNIPPSIEKIVKTWTALGNLVITIPKPLETSTKNVKSKVSLIEEKTYASTGTAPQHFSKVDYQQLNIKSQIHGNIVLANKTNLIKKDLELSEVFTPLQKDLFAIMNNYQDLYYPERTFTNADEIRYIYCLHLVNHMLKTRTKIVHHNAKISKKSDISDDYRDQGLVRPKVLILVPFKNTAYKVVKTIMEILVPKEAGQVVNKNRFEEDFTGEELIMPKKNPKPEDYELLFSGNTDDTFRLGMTLTKKTLKLYTDFYSSDIIVASPLGLRIIVGAEGEEERDYDFLASIEMLVMDQTDVFLMQNWDHLLHVLDHFHLQPKKTHGTDFSRVRYWAINGWSKYYRQTLVFSSVALPEIKSVINRKCHNYAGKVLVENPVESGTIQQVILQVPQVFHRFAAASALQSAEARFSYFVKEVLPKHRDPLMSHTLIYVPSYFDYVRIRNYFKKEDVSFVQICEYSKDSKIARARDMFFHTEAHFLLYSERVHFFRRFRIKGIRHIIFYQLPTYPHFYSEMCNLMQECNQNKYGGSACNTSVSALCCRPDAGRVAALLSAPRAAALLAADNPVHMFMTAD